jgi:hypothetical protein
MKNSEKTNKQVIAELVTKTNRLTEIIVDTLWMAQRYANGRRSYAVGQFNYALEMAKEDIKDRKIEQIEEAVMGSDELF